MLRIMVLSCLILLSLSSPGHAQQEDGTTNIVIWSIDFSPALVERQQALIAEFSELNPQVNIDLVVLDTVMMQQMMFLATNAGTPPDILLHPMEITYRFNQNQIFDTAFTTELIESLGAETFTQDALRLVRDEEGRYMAVPLYGEPMTLVYRQDWVEANDLPIPDDFDHIRDVAAALHDPDNGRYGFCGPTQRNETLINDTLEELAMANGARFVDAAGELTIATEAYIEALALYRDLLRNSGQQTPAWTASDVREGYLSGACAMIMWPLSIIDEIAGLQELFPPTCPECSDDPMFLARNSGFMTLLIDTDADVVRSRHEILVLGIYWGADELAREFVRFFMDRDYLPDRKSVV